MSSRRKHLRSACMNDRGHALIRMRFHDPATLRQRAPFDRRPVETYARADPRSCKLLAKLTEKHGRLDGREWKPLNQYGRRAFRNERFNIGSVIERKVPESRNRLTGPHGDWCDFRIHSNEHVPGTV